MRCISAICSRIVFRSSGEERFFGGFSGAGLVMIAIVTGAGTAFLLAFVWVLGVVVYYVVRRPPTQRPER